MDLLSVELPNRLRIRFRGPLTHRHLAAINLGHPAAHLAISDLEAVVAFARSDGSHAPWSPGDSGPGFYEDTRYRLIVENLAGTGTPQVVHRYPGLLDEVDQHEDQQFLTAALNFRSSVGISRLSFRAGNARLEVEIEVFPTKLDYETDFTALLHEVSRAARGLALEYLRATFIRGGTEETSKSSGLEWLVLLNNQLCSLELAQRYIAAHPHRVLEYYSDTLAIERLRRPDGTVRRAAIRGLGAGELRTVPGIGRLRPRLPSQRTRETLNTPEHRWLRHQLDLVRSQLAEIHSEIAAELQNARALGRSAVTLAGEQEEIANLLNRVQRLSRLNHIIEAVGPPPTGAPSLTLLNGVGYRESYRALLTLRLGLSLDGDAIDFSLKDLHVLYETWCFLRLAQLVATLAGVKRVSGDVIDAKTGGVRIRLKAGQRSEVTFDAGHRQLALLYNPTYPGLTGRQRPDVVLEFREHGWPRIIVVFDAKYRLQSDPDYVATFGTPGPPIDAVNALHRYRDAIVVAAGADHGRPTVKGIALFPLPADLAEQFSNSKLYNAIDELGVGALPFTPSSVELVAQWLADLLNRPLGQLAWPGPQFLAWERIRGTRNS